MKVYLEIILKPQPEIPLYFLWEKVYQQIHLALVEAQSSNGKSVIAISFPQFKNGAFPLGSKLRLFAKTQEQLQHLNIAKWLSRLTDYTHCTSIREVPPSVNRFACFKRKQCDSNIHRLARRMVKRKGVSLEQALDHYSDFSEQETNLPYVNMVSLSSNRERFRLFIERDIVEQPLIGDYSCYGLSSRESDKQATVPWF